MTSAESTKSSKLKFLVSTEWFVKESFNVPGFFKKGTEVLVGASLPFEKRELKKDWKKIKNLEKVGAFIYSI